MNKEFKVLAENVISTERFGKEMLFTRVCSAEGLQRYFFNEEDTYNVVFRNVEVELKEENTYATAVLGSYVEVSENQETVIRNIDILMSEVLGIFVSEEY